MRTLRTTAMALSLACAAAAQQAPPARVWPSAPVAASAPAQKPAATAQAAAPASTDVAVAADKPWTDTSVTLQAGDRCQFRAEGSVTFTGQLSTPDGLPRGWRDVLAALPVGSAGRGALIARIQGEAAPPAFVLGSKGEFVAATSGKLMLGVNQVSSTAGKGSYQVRLQVTRGVQPVTNSQPAPPVSKLDLPNSADLLAQVPRRIAYKQGNAGDMVNFAVLGAGDQVLAAFRAAGWVVVDRTSKEAVIHGLLATLSKQAYTELPMSELYLFDRPQDYGLAHADPLTVVSTRHHLRLWKAPFAFNGEEVWVGAATHDIGFDRDQRNNGVTHKIDPNVDDEREFVRTSLLSTGMIGGENALLPGDALKEAHTATGGSFHSDGRVFLFRLRDATLDRRQEFDNLFCNVLQKEPTADAGSWDCESLVGGGAAKPVDLAAIPNRYRVLIVPGVMSDCASMAPAFQEGQEHLRQAHGLDVALLPVPNASTESNAERVAAYLTEHAGDPRKYIVIGYSKGAPDVQYALATHPAAAAAVAGFVSVAGAVGGSPIAGVMPAQAERWMRALQLTSCQGDLTAAFQSLKREVRSAFNARYPTPPVPTYSLTAVADRAHTSKLLLENWLLVSAYGNRHDGLLLDPDSLIPGSTILGSVNADHFAIALPFDKLANSAITSLMDQNRFPRGALLESIVRFVVSDLEKKAPAPGQ